MTAEQLNIKMKLDISDIKSGVEKVKKSLSGMNDEVRRGLPKISSEGKKAKDSLEDVSEASDDVRQSLQKIGAEANTSLSRVKQMIAGIKSNGNLNDSLKVDASGASEAGASLESLQGTMNAIAGMDFFSLMQERWGGIKKHAKDAIASMADGFKGMKKAASDAISDFELVGKFDRTSWRFLKQDLKGIGSAFASAGKAAAAALGPILAIGAALVAVAGASIANNTKQFREEQSKLVTAFQTSGATAEQASQAYNGLFRFLGDSSKSVEAANHLAKLTNNTQELSEWTTICQGIYATFGDSLPIEGLTEAANETARVGKVTGVFADALNWAGENEDNFNAALARTTSFSEREALIRSTLNGLYQNAAQAYEKNNKQIIKQNEAQARLDATMARIGKHTQVLVTAWTNLKNVIMRVLSPAIVYISVLFSELINAIATAVKWIGSLFGIDFEDNKIEGAVSGVETSIGNATGATDGLTDSLDQATTAAEKLKRATMGFDELNVLPGKDTSTTGGGSTGNIGTGGGTSGSSIPLLPIDDLGIDKWQEKIDKWGEVVRALVPLALIGIGSVGAVLFALHGNWVGAIAMASLAGIGLIAMTQGDGGFQGYIDNFGKACNGLLVPAAIGIGAVGMVIFGLMGNWAGALACAGLAGIGLYAASQDGFQSLTDGFALTVTRIVSIAATAIGAIGAIVCLLTGNIPGAILFGAMAGLGITGLSVTGGWDWILDGIKGVWQSIKNWFNTNIKPVFTLDWWIDFFFPVVYAADGTGESTSESFRKKWGELKDWFKTNVAPVFTKDYWLEKWNSIKDGANEMWENFKNSEFAKFFNELKDKAVSLTATFKEKGADIRKNVTSAWGKVKTKAATLTSKFKEKGATIRKNVTSAWKSIKTKASTLTAKFKESGARKTLLNAWNTFKTKKSTITVAFKDAFTSAIKRAWNGLVKAINSAIGKINKIPGVNIGKLPYLATGGIATRATTAVIGEAGSEAVLPLEHNTGWMDILADRIASRSGGGPTTIVLKLDGRQLGMATIENINKITKQSGELQLVLG